MPWRLGQIGPVETLAAIAVKQDRVLVRFPDGCADDTARTVQAEADPARPPTTREDTFGHGKGARLEMFVAAERLVDELPKFAKRSDSDILGLHRG